MTGSERGFSDGLAALRGLAALVVVAFHCLITFRIGGVDDAYRLPLDVSQGWRTALHGLLFVFNGSACVSLFFVLSGAVLQMSLSRDVPFKAGSVPGYWIKRLFRLYPLLIVATLLAAAVQVALAHAAPLPGGTSWAHAQYGLPLARLPTAVVTNASAISHTLNAPAWSIKVEILASLIFPLLFLLAMRPRLVPAAAGVLLLSMFFFPHPERGEYISVYAFAFFIGALVPRYGAPAAAAYYRRSPWVRRAAAAIAAAAFLGARRLLGPDGSSPPTVVLVEVLAAAFIVGAVLFGPERAVFATRIARRAGELSYGVYLLHLPILFVSVHALAAVARPASPTAQLLAAGLLFVWTAAASLSLAAVTYRFVERPGQRLGRRLAGGLDARLRVPAQATSAA